jgi:hypothetical protein
MEGVFGKRHKKMTGFLSLELGNPWGFHLSLKWRGVIFREDKTYSRIITFKPT